MFGKDIQISLDKYQFTAGDVISGVVILTLTKPVKAKSLEVSFVVIEKSRTTKDSSRSLLSQMRNKQRRSNYSNSVSVREIYRFDMTLDGEHEYTESGKFPFQIVVPEGITPVNLQEVLPDNAFGKGVGLLANAAGYGSSRKYLVKARLKTPWSFDATDTVEVGIV